MKVWVLVICSCIQITQTFSSLKQQTLPQSFWEWGIQEVSAGASGLGSHGLQSRLVRMQSRSVRVQPVRPSSRLTHLLFFWCRLAAGWRPRLLPLGPLLGATCNPVAGSPQGPGVPRIEAPKRDPGTFTVSGHSEPQVQPTHESRGSHIVWMWELDHKES